MSPPERLVVEILAAADGQITGRVRMQKICYLLDQLGLQSGFSFQYHHYGPYSRELDEALDKAKAFQALTEKIEYRRADGMPYSIFEAKLLAAEAPGDIGDLGHARARSLILKLKNLPPTILELATTIHWLINKERLTDWRPELNRRKGAKVQNGRTEKALILLRELDLYPSSRGDVA